MNRSNTKQRSHGFTNHCVEHWSRDALHVMSYAIIGVLCRQGLTKLFGRYMPTTTPSPLFPELAANMLGSFIMGVTAEGHITFIRASSPSVHTAVTAGFCGSFSTFSSWMVYVTKLFIEKQIILAIGSLVIGIILPLGAYQFGRHFYILCESCILFWHSEDVPVADSFEIEQHPDIRLVTASSTDLFITEKEEGNHAICVPSDASQVPSEGNQPSKKLPSTFSKKLMSVHRNLSRIKNSCNVSPDHPAANTAEQFSTIQHDVIKLKTVMAEMLSTYESRVWMRQNTTPMEHTTINDIPLPVLHRWHNDVLIVIITVVFLIMISGLIVAVCIDKSIQRTQLYWLPALLAPPGALTRWQLAKLNRHRGELCTNVCVGRIPAGTFISNILGACFASILSGLSDRGIGQIATGNLSGVDISAALKAGFCGCLTTVSSFVAELHLLPLSWSYLYGTTTFVTSVAICLLFLKTIV